jgi:hypothetical protein
MLLIPGSEWLTEAAQDVEERVGEEAETGPRIDPIRDAEPILDGDLPHLQPHVVDVTERLALRVRSPPLEIPEEMPVRRGHADAGQAADGEEENRGEKAMVGHFEPLPWRQVAGSKSLQFSNRPQMGRPPSETGTIQSLDPKFCTVDSR